jgi:hypothetical protein
VSEQHTPAPWHLAESGSLMTWVMASVDRRLAAVVSRSPEQQANARLIAAAPDLLDAIGRWLEYDDIDLRGACEYGQTDADECIGDGEYEPVCPACQLRAAIAKATGEARGE